MTDIDRHSPTQSDIGGQQFTLDVQQAQALFDVAGLPRSVRSITRYCQSQRLDAVTIDGPTGPEWRISEVSVMRAIDELKRTFSVSDTAGTGQPQPAMADLKNKDKKGETEPAKSPQVADSVRQDEDSRYVEQLETRIVEKDVVIGMLRGELAQRNEELVRRNERERETNVLIRGLQNLFLQLQPGSAREADVLDNDPAMETERQDGAASK